MSDINKLLNSIFYISDEYKIKLPPKDFFINSLLLLKEKCTKDELLTLLDYKTDYFLHINGVLYDYALPKSLDTSDYGIYEFMTSLFKVNKYPNLNFQGLSIQLIHDFIQYLYLLINDLDNIFKKVDTLYDIVLFRSIQKKEKLEKNYSYDALNYKIGEKITFKGFTSTSLNPLIPKYFGNVIFVMKIRKEHKIPFIFLSSIFFKRNLKKNGTDNIVNAIKWSNWKNIDDEFEIVLPRDCEFIVKNIRNIKHKDIKIPKKFSNIFNNKNAENIDYIFYYVESLPYKFPEEFNHSINSPDKIIINI